MDRVDGDSQVIAPPMKKGGSRRGRALMIFVQVALAAGLLAAILMSMRGSTSQTLAVPEIFAGMRLMKQVEGKEAVAQMNKLHGTDIGVISGYLADYAGDRPTQRMTVWSGKTRDDATAAELLRVMTGKIAAGNPVFTGLEKLTLEGKTVYTVKSGDGTHFYYQSRDAVVWLAITSRDPLSVAKEAVRVF
ncbi:MAG: hypothetical protein HYX92_07060 [Chloroflexi bacterium]|nr:hypothetical protein [Chloroflexota bacterium]